MSVDLLKVGDVERHVAELRDKLSQYESVETLLQDSNAELGPLAKLIVIYWVMNSRTRISASEMATKLWNEMPDSERSSIASDEHAFRGKIRRWFQPSQIPSATLNKSQAENLLRAAVAIAGRILGEETMNIQVNKPWRSARRLASTLISNRNYSKYIDQKFLEYLPLFNPSHEGIVDFIYKMYLIGERNGTDLLCIVGEPYSGKKSILSNLIQKYTDGPNSLPVFAIQCAGMTYTEVGVRVASFLEFLEDVSASDSGPRISDQDKLRLIRAQAKSQAAIYVFADLELLAGNAASRLIRQEEVVELIEVLLSSNPRTKVIVSSEETQEETPELGRGGRAVAPFTFTSRNLEWADADCGLVRLAPATIQSLLRALEGVIEKEALVCLQPFHADPIEGVALGFCAAFLRLCADQKRVPEGIRDIEAILRSARELRLEPVLYKFWELLLPEQQVLSIVIAASDDGIRKSSLDWVLDRLLISRENLPVKLETLRRIFGNAFHREDPDQPWGLDDLPGEGIKEPLFELNLLTRRAILTALENRKISEPKPDLMRRVHWLIAAKAREEAQHRRLNVPGVYGARLSDLLRDIQALLSLIASVSLDQGDDRMDHQGELAPKRQLTQARTIAQRQRDLSPLEVERAVFDGHADGRTTLRFAFLQMWRQDIDRDYRLNTVHAADELRLHILLSIATYSGRSFFPSQRYEVEPSDFDSLTKVFSGDELPEFLTSLAIAAHQAGEFKITHAAANYGETQFKWEEGQEILRTKLRRALIDTQVLVGHDPNLSEIKARLREIIDNIEKQVPDIIDSRSGKEACLKLNLRLGEVCYLQGERDEAHAAFETAVCLEKELAGEESCIEGRSLISGHGARRFLRAVLSWAADDAKEGRWHLVDGLMSRGRDLHNISLRRLSRHAADRAGVLLDEALIHHVTGYVLEQKKHERDREVHNAYRKAKNLIVAAQEFALQPGLPIAIKLDLDDLVAMIGIQLAGVYAEDRDELLERCNTSVKRLRRIADRFDLKIYKAYSRLLMFRLGKARIGIQVYSDSRLVADLQDARKFSEISGLGLYKAEIDHYLEKAYAIASGETNIL